MCGRFAFFSAHEATVRLFGLPASTPAIAPRYNIAPTTQVPVVRVDHEGVRRLAMLHWGLVPHWAKEKSIGSRMINARAETLAEKPSFRTALRKRRCLVLASGYYEWQVTPSGKQPWFIRQASLEPFAMAGLWESWIERVGGTDSAPLESCTIVTTEASGPLAAIHHRVPAILDHAECTAWLDPGQVDGAANSAADIAVKGPGSVTSLGALLHAPADGLMQALRISTRVNNVRNDGPELLTPIPDDTRH